MANYSTDAEAIDAFGAKYKTLKSEISKIIVVPLAKIVKDN